jgi:hypothetical protein
MAKKGHERGTSMREGKRSQSAAADEASPRAPVLVASPSNSFLSIVSRDFSCRPCEVRGAGRQDLVVEVVYRSRYT